MSSTSYTEEVPITTRAETAPADHVIVLFGSTGDLVRRKLLPGLFHLVVAGLGPGRMRVIGASRRQVDADAFRARAREAIGEFGREPPQGEAWEAFSASLSTASIDGSLEGLSEAVAAARDELGEGSQLLHYLAIPPGAGAPLVAQLGEAGLNDSARIVMEKPFGTDADSARRLDKSVLSVFEESQIFRIDHYLGREAVQNLLALRFANGMFEPIWNRDHIDHIQIDVPETLSIEMRGDFYEQTGALRDMVVTHLFQVLGFVAMDSPTSLDAHHLMIERQRVFDTMATLRPEDVVRGQYRGYRDVDGVAADSDTETFVALRARVDNWRWAGVPFFLRTGKRLAENRRLLTVAFKQPPLRMFPLDCRYVAESFGFDHLSFELGDPGSISASFLAKAPGPALRLGEARMDFSFAGTFAAPEQSLDAYERLLHDVMLGDHTLFTDSEAVERLWDVSGPVLEEPPPVRLYEPGSWGPEDSRELIAPRRWHLPGHHV